MDPHERLFSTALPELVEQQHGVVTRVQLFAVGVSVSHVSAGRLWGMSSVPADPAVHVTVPGGDRKRPGIVVHRAPTTGADVTRHRGVPVTTPSRTLVDLADVVPYATLRRIADHGLRLDGPRGLACAQPPRARLGRAPARRRRPHAFRT